MSNENWNASILGILKETVTLTVNPSINIVKARSKETLERSAVLLGASKDLVGKKINVLGQIVQESGPLMIASTFALVSALAMGAASYLSATSVEAANRLIGGNLANITQIGPALRSVGVIGYGLASVFLGTFAKNTLQSAYEKIREITR